MSAALVALEKAAIAADAEVARATRVCNSAQVALTNAERDLDRATADAADLAAAITRHKSATAQEASE